MAWPNRTPPSGIPAGGPGSGDARRYSRPPFPPNNGVALHHGATSERVYLPLARVLADGLLDRRPDLAPWPEAIEGWAVAEAVCVLLRRHVATAGEVDGEGEVRGKVLANLRQYEQLAARHRDTLGLDPRSSLSLAKERVEAIAWSVDLAELAQRGAAIAAARDRRDDPPDVAGELLDAAREQATS